jgi:hypothetical protein
MSTCQQGAFVPPTNEYAHISSFHPWLTADHGYAPLYPSADQYRGHSSEYDLDPEAGLVPHNHESADSLPYGRYKAVSERLDPYVPVSLIEQIKDVIARQHLQGRVPLPPSHSGASAHRGSRGCRYRTCVRGVAVVIRWAARTPRALAACECGENLSQFE